MNDSKRLADTVRARLDQSLDELDPAITAQLAQARRQALTSKARRPVRRWTVSAVALAASVALAALLVGRDPVAPDLDGVHAFELVAADEPLELYEELDFFLWLETQQVDPS